MPGGLQRVVSIFSAVRNVFFPPRSHYSAFAHLPRLNAIAEWKAPAAVAALVSQATGFASVHSIPVNVTIGNPSKSVETLRATPPATKTL